MYLHDYIRTADVLPVYAAAPRWRTPGTDEYQSPLHNVSSRTCYDNIEFTVLGARRSQYVIPEGAILERIMKDARGIADLSNITIGIVVVLDYRVGASR